MAIISKELINELRGQFNLDWRGIHGVSHWSRVRLNGLNIAKTNNANTDVIELFAFLHDSQRLNDDYDPEHGFRAVEYARTLRSRYFDIDDLGFELLELACRHHSESSSIINPDITVQTCWDADRLDLGRVGTKPNPELLYTSTAKASLFLENAYSRSVRVSENRDFEVLVDE